MAWLVTGHEQRHIQGYTLPHGFVVVYAFEHLRVFDLFLAPSYGLVLHT
jgi:hypothetical protein